VRYKRLHLNSDIYYMPEVKGHESMWAALSFFDTRKETTQLYPWIRKKVFTWSVV